MSKLNFSSINDAFILSSDQIKTTQEEIASLKKLIIESNGIITQPSKQFKKDENKTPKLQTPINDKSSQMSNFQQMQTTGYQQMQPMQNTGYPQQPMQNTGYQQQPAQTTSYQQQPMQNDDNFNYNFFKLMQNPKFDDAVNKYIKSSTQEDFNNNISYFGNKYSRTVCSEIKNYIIFFIISLVIYLFLSLYLSST